MIPRHASARLQRLLKGFPVVTVTGPRQSGKTTLVRTLVPTHPYVTLESPEQREFARRRPAEFLRQYPNGAVIDEAQHAPELFSQIQVVVDESGAMGQFVLTGSHNLSLLSGITQSLAGRTALMELPPLALAELREAGLAGACENAQSGSVPGLYPGSSSGSSIGSYASLICKGFFPALYSRDVGPYEWLQGYLVTYAERDARQLAAIQDLGAFQRFLVLTAARTGQQLNMQSLANDVGVSDKTVRHWLSILETCYLIHFVRPHTAQLGKRLTKMPKLYMTDVGLAAALLGIRTPEQAQAHPLRGALFETLVVNEFLKARWNGGDRSMLYYWRDHVGTEVDLVMERGNGLAGVEIKSGLHVDWSGLKGLHSWHKYATQRGQFDAVHLGVVYGGESAYEREGVSVLPWAAL
jgi:uncharacterized protein